MNPRGKLVLARQYYDGMSEEYEATKVKGRSVPYLVVLGLCVGSRDVLWGSYIDVMDSAGRVHNFNHNFNFDVIDSSELNISDDGLAKLRQLFKLSKNNEVTE